jgi:RNA polymerase sigma-70 factor (ECF subfamily)
MTSSEFSNGDNSPPNDEPSPNDEFMRLFAQHCDRIQGYIGTLLPSTADADEVFQQTSITLWRKFAEFRADGNFTAWACGIAFNLIRNYRRVESRRPVFLLGDDVLEALGNLQLASHAQLTARREALDLCLEKLSVADRNVVDRCYGSSDDLKSVATELGRTANALYKRLKTIRRTLFDCISRTLAREENR